MHAWWTEARMHKNLDRQIHVRVHSVMNSTKVQNPRRNSYRQLHCQHTHYATDVCMLGILRIRTHYYLVHAHKLASML